MSIENMKIKDISKETLQKYLEQMDDDLPTTWEGLKEVSGYYVTAHSTIGATRNHEKPPVSAKAIYSNTFSTKELAKASIAVAMLSQLRDEYNGDWKPDWDSYQESKYTLEYYDHINPSAAFRQRRFLAFKSKELRDKFLDNFRDLIKQARPILGG